MATPKKKHLIELMIEEGVEWHKGAEYAAQDKRDGKVYFFSRKPSVLARDNYHSAPDGPIGYSCLLPSLCRNWNQTIVTREQYAEAVAAAGNGGHEQQPQPHQHSGEAGVMPSESIESLLAEIKAKREEHASLVAKAEALALEISSIEQRVNDKLKEYGFAMSPVAAPSGSVDEPWKIGDKCIVTDSPCNELWVDIECVLVNIDEDDKNLHYLVKHQNKGRCWVRDIRRP